MHGQGLCGEGLCSEGFLSFCSNRLFRQHLCLVAAYPVPGISRQLYPSRLEEAVQPRFLNWKDSVGASCTPERAELWNFGRYQDRDQRNVL